MKSYRELLENANDEAIASIVDKEIEYANTWQEVFEIGECLSEAPQSGILCKQIMDAYEKAHRLGLNIRVNRESFLLATQQLAKIYFQFQKYDEATNMLMVLDSNVDQLPDWVNLYYASAQIHTETVLYWAEVPKHLFNRIDSIDLNNPESVRRRKILYLEFLNRLITYAQNKNLPEINIELILQKANELGLSEYRECLNFKYEMGLIAKPADEDSEDTGEEIEALPVSEEPFGDLIKKIARLQGVIDKKDIELERKKIANEGQQQLIEKLEREIKDLTENTEKLALELKKSKEKEYELHTIYKNLEKQAKGTEASKKQIEEYAAIIGELKAETDTLKVALSLSEKSAESTLSELNNKQTEIDELRILSIEHKEKEQKLNAEILELKSKNEMAESHKKCLENNISEGSEMQRDEDTSICDDNLDVYNVDNFLSRGKKILIIGGTEAKEVDIRGKLKKMGFNFSKNQLDFQLNYDDVKNYASRIKPWNGRYAGIIVGPCPHKVKDTNGYSSLIQQLRSEDGYPHLEEARENSGSLKITKTSIAQAMEKMSVHLQSIS